MSLYNYKDTVLQRKVTVDFTFFFRYTVKTRKTCL